MADPLENSSRDGSENGSRKRRNENVTTLINCYQQPDEDTLRAVVEFTPSVPQGRSERLEPDSHGVSHTPQIGEARQRLSRCRASLPLLGSIRKRRSR